MMSATQLDIAGALTGLALATPALAHTQAGSLGTSESATDYFQITCSDDGAGTPGSLAIQVRDEGPQGDPIVNVQITRLGEFANASDPDDTDSAYGPLVTINGGPGVYKVLVDKTGSGGENYRLDFHCVTGPDGTGQHTGTSISTRQNQ